MTKKFLQMFVTAGKSRLVIIVMTGSILSGCAYIDSTFRGGNEQREAVARSVKAELISSPAVEAAPLNVRVEDKTIVLYGFVELLEEKLEAEKLVRELYPTFDVLNNINVH